LGVGNYSVEPDHRTVRYKYGSAAVMGLVDPRLGDVQDETLAQQFPDRVHVGSNEHGFNCFHAKYYHPFFHRNRFSRRVTGPFGSMISTPCAAIYRR